MKGKKSMEQRLKYEFERRSELTEQFYYRDIGQVLKRIRTKQKMTQESVAYGICSHTYISKLENNQIVGKRESISLIMERMNIAMEDIYFPEEMLSSLNDAIRLFFYRDIEGYKKIYDKLSKYHFSTLLQVIKLGYHIITNNYQEAKLIYNEIFRYLNSLEDYGLSIFLLFASFYNIGIQNYTKGKQIIDEVESKFISDDIIYGLYNLSKYIIYGNLFLFFSASEALNNSITILNKYSNLERINEIHVWRKLFEIYETNYNETFHSFNLRFIDNESINRFLSILALTSENPYQYLNYLDKNSENYALGLFIKAKLYLDEQKLDLFDQVYDELNKIHYQNETPIDYSHILRLMKAKKYIDYKEYLTNFVLTYVENKQDLFFSRLVTSEIVKLLTMKNRYKDALSYKNRFEKTVFNLRNPIKK